MKNSSKISHYLSNLWMNISGIKQIVYQPMVFGIQSLFILFHLVQHRIVHTETLLKCDRIKQYWTNSFVQFHSILFYFVDELFRFNPCHEFCSWLQNHLLHHSNLKLNCKILKSQVSNLPFNCWLTIWSHDLLCLFEKLFLKMKFFLVATLKDEI